MILSAYQYLSCEHLKSVRGVGVHLGAGLQCHRRDCRRIGRVAVLLQLPDDGVAAVFSYIGNGEVLTYGEFRHWRNTVVAVEPLGSAAVATPAVQLAVLEDDGYVSNIEIKVLDFVYVALGGEIGIHGGWNRKMPEGIESPYIQPATCVVFLILRFGQESYDAFPHLHLGEFASAGYERLNLVREYGGKIRIVHDACISLDYSLSCKSAVALYE